MLKFSLWPFLATTLLSTATLAVDVKPVTLPMVHELITQKRFSEVEGATTAALANLKDAKEQEPWLYFKAWGALEGNEPQKTIETCDEVLKGKPVLEEEFRSLRAQALELLQRPKEALEEDRHLLKLAPNMRLVFDANLRVAHMILASDKGKESRRLLKALEKKARGTPQYADVVVELARAERKFGGASAACPWLRKIYLKNPTYSLIKDWGPDLAKNEFDGKQTGCANSRDEFRDRVRALLWSGEEEKARLEVEQVAQSFPVLERASADELKSWFLLQTGAPDAAFTILQDIYPQRKNDKEFLMIYASAAARAGQSSAAVGAFHRVYELSSGSKARKALYQSALMSYQFRDYDGASRKFHEFIRKNPRSGLVSDAKWNLAWISYLKGDFQQALHDLQDLSSKSRRGILRERVRYWTAMSELRLDRVDQARALFASIAEDRSGSYYGTAARQRLASLPAAPVIPHVDEAHFRFFGPVKGAGFLYATSDFSEEIVASEETESEENLAAQVDPDEGKDEPSEENATEITEDNSHSEILETGGLTKTKNNALHFERAQMLLKMGLNDEVRWELFEIEKRIHSKEELQQLVAIYQQSGNFHRSASLAQLRYGNLKNAQGQDGARQFWEAAYPQAYKEDVMASAKESAMPSEFIWGIMRAESQYRRDAVSPVGAMGLMQIMPGTGRKLANLRQDKTFSPVRLLQADTAIHYGAFYLKRLGRLFDGSVPLTAAAYNAGPHRVHAWLLAFGRLDMDEFIEHIPFIETREYVRKVVANTLIYSNLYNGGRDLVSLSSPVTIKGSAELSRKENWE